MWNPLKKIFGSQEDQAPVANRGVEQRAIRAVESDVGKSIPHQLIYRTREQLGGVLGRFSKVNGANRVEVSRDVVSNTAEHFKTLYHELLHAAGLMDEGTVEGLTQLAAIRHGIQDRVKAVAYPKQVQAFNEVAELVTSGVRDARERFKLMLNWARANEFTRHAKTATAFRERGHGSSEAHAKTQELLSALQ